MYLIWTFLQAVGLARVFGAKNNVKYDTWLTPEDDTSHLHGFQHQRRGLSLHLIYSLNKCPYEIQVEKWCPFWENYWSKMSILVNFLSNPLQMVQHRIRDGNEIRTRWGYPKHMGRVWGRVTGYGTEYGITFEFFSRVWDWVIYPFTR
jgi:hypothetical protein